MIENYAPILIPTLNRYEHFKRCINSLKECDFSSQTDLFIALDYPLKDSHWDGYNKILKLIDEVEGFNTVNIIKREINFGANKNGSDALNFIFSKYKTLIFSEDDNVFSKDFLMFTNRCLEVYKDDDSIFSVCGYNYPIEIPKFYKNEIYTWQGYSAWGVGLWRDKFLKIDWSKEVVQSEVKSLLNNYTKIIQLNKIGNHYIPALLHMHNVQQVHGDTYISMYQFLNNMTSVFPVISRVRNMGHDGSGVNCVVIEDNVFSAQEIYRGSDNYEIPKILKADEFIAKILYNHFKTQLKSKIKLFVKLILFNSGFNWSKK
jgi:hypothetical protein